MRALFADGEGRLWAGHVGLGPRAADRQDRPRGDASTTRRSPRSPRSPRTERARLGGRRRRGLAVAERRADLASRRRCRRRSPPRRRLADGRRRPPKPEVTVSRLDAAPGARRGAPRAADTPPRSSCSTEARAAAQRLDELGRGRLRSRPDDPAGAGVFAGHGPQGQALRDLDARRLVAGADVRREAGDVPRGRRRRARTRRRPCTGADPAARPASTSRRSRTPAGPAGSARSAGKARRPRGTKIEFAFRSGESSTPDATWSAWSAWETARPVRGDPRPPTGASCSGRSRMAVGRLAHAADPAHRGGLPQPQRRARGRDASSRSSRPRSWRGRARAGRQRLRELGARREGHLHGLEEPKSEGSPRKLFRKGYRTLQWKATDPDGDALVYEIEFRPAAGAKWMLAAQGPSRHVLLVRLDVPARRRVRFPRDARPTPRPTRATRSRRRASPRPCGSTTRPR